MSDTFNVSDEAHLNGDSQVNGSSNVAAHATRAKDSLIDCKVSHTAPTPPYLAETQLIPKSTVLIFCTAHTTTSPPHLLTTS